MRHELLGTHLSASVNFPLTELESALTRGRADFKWRQLRQWLTPQPTTSQDSHDEVIFELPMAVLIPQFLAHRAQKGGAKKLTVGEEIPDVFLTKTQKEAAVPHESPVAFNGASHKNEQRSIESREPAAAHKPMPVAPAVAAPIVAAETHAGNKSSILPKELVQRACKLTGVAGALVATHDGLVVAAQMPPGMHAETAAAFLPQIFPRVSQYVRELKLGEPVEVAIVLQKAPLEIYRTNSAYFAVIGKASEALPKPQLSVLAGQLSA
jgi:predicted regulator of Ras-like GTPase activity (Roadblock/LC7/MglB family)